MVAFRRTRRKQIPIAIGQEVIFGRQHSTHSLQPDIDLNEYNAMAYGVSRLHAKLRHEEYGWWLEDLASANGTWVNGERLEPYTPVSLGVKNQIILSTFQFHLFLPSRMVAGINVPNSESKSPLHVVNIEDDRDLQRLMAMAFKESEPNLNLAQFISGDQALPYIMEHKDTIDLFVIDIMLPGKYNGIEIAHLIRQIGAPGHISLTSAFAEPTSDLLSELRAEFFPKPLHILDIIPRLASYRLKRGGLPSGVISTQAIASGVAHHDQTLPKSPRSRSAQTVTSSGLNHPGVYEDDSPAAREAGSGAYVGVSGRQRAVAEVPTPYRPPSYEFDSLGALEAEAAPVAVAAVAASDAKPLPVIQPLPSLAAAGKPARQTTVKLNIVQKLINKLKGL
jgi:pSer/pThr/pTyr-binding forkhead associated (FHA) protein